MLKFIAIQFLIDHARFEPICNSDKFKISQVLDRLLSIEDTNGFSETQNVDLEIEIKFEDE